MERLTLVFFKFNVNFDLTGFIFEEKTDIVPVKIHKIQQQTNSVDCGVFAIAFMTEFCFSGWNGKNSIHFDTNQETMSSNRFGKSHSALHSFLMERLTLVFFKFNVTFDLTGFIFENGENCLSSMHFIRR
jgi:succinate dehydrogenase hydrophobic anchor subunit